ncbi:c-type cytochrome [Roseateles chitinivorans]|uniref:c-type cytochrome n=1 Tax=Roseateles chitinivorans TaxID=2917965 RepID=UPI003D67062B
MVGPDTSNGPRLSGLAGRDRIGGKAAPTEEGLTAWIRDPQAIDAHNAMPTLGVSETQARLMARYLLTH